MDSSLPFVQAIAFAERTLRTLAFARTVNTRIVNSRMEKSASASVAGDTPPAVAISYGLKAIPQARFAIGIALNNFKLSIPANTLGVNSSRKLTATPIR